MQWEFQVGPSVGISAADELWVARYILEVTSKLPSPSLLLPFTNFSFLFFFHLTEDYGNGWCGSFF